ncbi:MAG: cytoskeletal protein CcmA (bactofilin family) [Ilumatobacter sp.]|jgi:cytoskeletal protein CcmA (bactofilin family)
MSRSARAALFMRSLVRPAFVVLVALSAIGVGHAASLGGLNSADMTSFASSGTVPIPTAPPTTPPTTTVPPPPPNICGSGDTTLPCVVEAGTVINGKLDWDGDVTVLGTVSKKVTVDNGDVVVGPGGAVGGKITQSGAGGVVVELGGTASGDIKESGDGSVVVAGLVNGNVSESDDGNLTVSTGGVVRGNATEQGAGSVTVDGRVDGGVTESNNGDLTVGPTAFIGNGVDSKPGGACMISPTATVNGRRNGVCA